MFENKNTVLVLAPHPDDAEFGLGGTLSKLKESGKDIHIVVFSMCEKSTPIGFKNGVIESELSESVKLLGLSSSNLHKLYFEVREFPKYRQEILEELILIRKKINPDLVFIPNSFDVHQDHNTVYIEGKRAFKNCSILGYEMPWNNFGVKTDVFVSLEQKHLDHKIELLECYKSQTSRTYSNFDFVKSLAILRGTQIQKSLAESFELIRFID